ncbi:MAG: (d)CMP kinase [Gemmatimonadaceae bacterium]
MSDTFPDVSDSIAPARRPLVVAIDGPAASGKSSTAQWVAERLGVHHVDSGALYRAATAVALRSARPPEGWDEAFVLARCAAVTLAPGSHSFVPLIGGAPVDEELRGAEVTRHVSRVARMPGVRGWVNERVRRTAERHDVVVDGRDIGTVVFPEADVKIFLVADPWERARRRLVQRLGRRPADEEIAEETERIVQRDARDATQTVQAADAVLIDTTYLTQPEQVERIVALARAVVRGVARDDEETPSRSIDER